MGMIFEKTGQLNTRSLVVSHQYVSSESDRLGDIFKYNRDTGVLEKVLVPHTDSNAPYAPHGIVQKGSQLYVADLGNLGIPGNVSVYDEESGKFLGNLAQNAIQDLNYHPRAVVFGPDGNLYVSDRDLSDAHLKAGQIGGHVLRFTPSGKFIDVFIHDNGGVNQLNRPEGLVFGPDGNLYITSFRDNNNPNTDTDSIRIYSANGEFLRKIDLYPVGHPEQRAYAQAILFGPNGRLFVPITNGLNHGEVRRYNVADGTYDSFIKAGGLLQYPWYLTFEKTDPSTLAYRGE
jgi:DNA-binding beta-propeller fold protein YncE